MKFFARKQMDFPDDEIMRLRRKLAEAERRIRALEEKAERVAFLDAVVQGIAEPVVVIDTEHNIILRNAAADGFWGLPKEGETYYKCHEVLHGEKEPCDKVGWPCPVRQVMETGQPVTVPHEHVREGGKRLYEILASPLVISGELVGIIETARDITESRKAADELEKTKSRLEFLTNNNPAVLYASEARGTWRATYISANVRDVLGYEPDDFLRNPGFGIDHIHPDDRERAVAAAEHIFEGETVQNEYRFLHKDGSWRWMHDEIRLVRGADGQPLECIGYWIDITDRKLAEILLKESEERFRSIYESSLDAIIVSSPEGRNFAANPAACRMLGYTEEELMGIGRDGIVDHSDPHLLKYLEDRKNRGSARAELTLVRKDGSKFPADVTASLFLDREGRPRASVIMRDITRRKRDDEELKKFKFILENAGEEFYLIDMAGNFEFVNRAALRSLGYSKEELLGLNLSDIDPNYSRIRIPGHFEDLRRGDLAPFETVHRTKDGRLVAKEVKSVYLEIENKGYVCSFVRDVSERKALERQRSDFLAMVTHDLKSPLTAILGYSELIKDECLRRGDESVRAMAEAVEQGGHKLLRLVEDFLTVSRMETETLELKKAPADVIDVLAKVEREFSLQAKNSGISLTVKSPREPMPQPYIDRPQVERVLGNLVQNAINYTPSGGSINLGAEESLKEGRRYIKVFVSDTGRGIPKEEQPKVFSKYYRSSRTAGIKGSGLGLTIAKAITEAHGGWIELESEPGKGSIFSLFLPV